MSPTSYYLNSSALPDWDPFENFHDIDLSPSVGAPSAKMLDMHRDEDLEPGPWTPTEAPKHFPSRTPSAASRA